MMSLLFERLKALRLTLLHRFNIKVLQVHFDTIRFVLMR